MKFIIVTFFALLMLIIADIPYMILFKSRKYNLPFRYSLGIRSVCFSIEDNIINHEHTCGYILFCNLCWWKEVFTINNELICYSFKHCSSDVKLHQTKVVRICKTVNTIEWDCTYCSM